MAKYKTGIVLSGGGARGFAHLGVLKALNEHGIFPDIISAVSAGALVGALYADGKTPDEIFKIYSGLDIYRALRIYKPAFGMLKARGISKALDKNLSVRKIEELRIPLIISATNFTKAITEYFHEGDILETVLASSAIPLILKPYLRNGQMYVDGGLMNNLPVEPLLNNCETIIGVNVNPVHEETHFRTFRNYADRVLHLAIRANVKNNIGLCDMYIEPPGLMAFNLFKVSVAEEIFKIGYKHTKKFLNKELG